MNFNINRLCHLGNKYGWIKKSQNDIKILFVNTEGNILCIEHKKNNIITIIKHPKWGTTVLQRSGIFTYKIIESIFRNPRVHTPLNIKSQYL